MRHGYHMGVGFYGSYILIILLAVVFFLAIMLLRSKPSEDPFVIRLIDILKEKYAAGIITVDEYIERKAILEEIKFSNPYTAILMERYARCNISTQEFLNIKNELENRNSDSSVCESLAKGDLKELYEKLDLQVFIPKDTKLKDIQNTIPDFEVETAREKIED